MARKLIGLWKPEEGETKEDFSKRVHGSIKERIRLHNELQKVAQQILDYKPKKKSKKKPKLVAHEVVLPHEDETFFL